MQWLHSSSHCLGAWFVSGQHSSNIFLNLFVNQFSWLMQTSGCWEQGCKTCIEVQIQVVVAAAGSWEDHSHHDHSCWEDWFSSIVQGLLRRPEMIPNTGAIWTCKPWLLQIWTICLCLLQKREENHQNIKIRLNFRGYFTAEKFFWVVFLQWFLKTLGSIQGHVYVPLWEHKWILF